MSNFADRILAQLDPGDLKRVGAELGSFGSSRDGDWKDYVEIKMPGYIFTVVNSINGVFYELSYQSVSRPDHKIRSTGNHPRPEIAFRQVVRAITGEFGWTVERLKKEWSK